MIERNDGDDLMRHVGALIDDAVEARRVSEQSVERALQTLDDQLALLRRSDERVAASRALLARLRPAWPPGAVGQ